MNYEKKYLKYKQKYIELKKIIQKGGGICGVCRNETDIKCECGLVYYCSDKCKNEAWPNHKVLCIATRDQFISKVLDVYIPRIKFSPAAPAAPASAHKEDLYEEDLSNDIILEPAGDVSNVVGEPVLRLRLQDAIKEFGYEHPDTLLSMKNLANSLIKRGNLKDMDEAEPLLRKVIEVSSRTLGSKHPDTLLSMSDLAILLKKLAKLNTLPKKKIYLEEAELLNRNILEVIEGWLREKFNRQRAILGIENSLTLETMNRFAETLIELGKLAEAEALFRETFNRQRAILGIENSLTLETMNRFAELLIEQRKLAEAETLYTDMLQALRKTLGSKHIETLRKILDFAYLLMRLDKFEEADKLFLEAGRGFREVTPENTSLINSIANSHSNAKELHLSKLREERSKRGE